MARLRTRVPMPGIEKRVSSSSSSRRKTLLGPVYGSPIEQVQLLPVKTATELRKRYLVFVNRDKVFPSARRLRETSLARCASSGGRPRVSHDSQTPGFVAEAATASQPSPAQGETENCHRETRRLAGAWGAVLSYPLSHTPDEDTWPTKVLPLSDLFTGKKNLIKAYGSAICLMSNLY